ncbi:MAG: response regulator [Pseudomonadales bacterium]|nr:response regulator [Pseudomonadales bacterium]
MPANLDILVAHYENEAIQLTAALCGKDAQVLAKELQPDLILLDIMMQDMDAYKVCRRLKSDLNTAGYTGDISYRHGGSKE